ncbi:uncharacterized protein LOC127791959 [Diospyros lotus]|uniref:uncharacterized protein LOC127791959 n=1 Tax=Diospyros lotus TaxID=55363 RepID=UPI002259BECF|nr:uncharacterized protein LOC127791959 [Diospyros lotus]
MASSRANKYASLNFNDIYDKKKIAGASSASSPSSPLSSPTSRTVLSNSRIHGHMLVLSRPSPKPIAQLSPPLPSSPRQQQRERPAGIRDQIRSEEDTISLRPLGRTGSPLTLPKPEKEFSASPCPSPSTKPDRFVPPHLRPGFAGREEKPGFELQKQQGVRSREIGGHRPNRLGEDGRPKSGGGYERVRRVGDSDLMEMNRPGSIGTRPSSSGL